MIRFNRRLSRKGWLAHMKKALVWLLMTIMLCGMALSAVADIDTYTKCGTHGTAKRLNGRTAVVSMFVSDPKWVWDISGKDIYSYSEVYQRLLIAAEWIEQEAAKYSVRCEMICDWLKPENYDLYREFTTDQDLFSGNYSNDYRCFTSLIDSMDVDSIMRKHNAENILFMIYLNTGKKSKNNSKIYGYAQPSSGELARNVGAFEFVVLPIGKNYPPGTYAHEILHLYGCPDMYGPSDEWGFTAKFIKDMKRRYPRELFNGVPSYKYDRVEYVLSPLSAYYCGLTRYSEDQQKWNLRKSEYDLYGY